MRALGCMRIGEAAPIRAALEHGAEWLDTADAYHPPGGGVGDNERLIRAVLDGWTGARPRISTKIGLTRPRGAWVPDGRRKHLLTAAEASAERLGAPPDLLLLHALDPRTKPETSFRALAAIHERGLAREVGVCNVRLHELRQATELAPIRAVQLAASPLDDEGIRGGVVAHCLSEGILAFAHSPFGGPRKAARLGRDPALRKVAERVGRSPWAVALAWLRSLGLIPVPGPTRLETLRDLLDPPELDSEALELLDAAFPAARILRLPIAERRPPADAEGDVVLLMGSPASGKSTAVLELVDQGYHRLNRDLVGGTLAQVAASLGAALEAGERRVVLDNTYPTRAQRSRVIETAWEHGVPVRCLYKTTGAADAQLNACLRMVRRHGRLLEPDEMKKLARTEPNSFPPRVLHQWPSKLEEPSLDEGFARLEHLPFDREWPEGGPAGWIVDAREPERWSRGFLEERVAAGDLALGIGWSGGGPAPGDLEVEGLRLQTLWCTHPPGPPICWCRPPLPGLAATWIVRLGLGAVHTEPPD